MIDTPLITIRTARIEDAKKIALAERDIADEPGFFCSEPSELTDMNVLKTITELKDGKSGIYLVAECETTIVGHAFLEALHLKSICHVAELTIAVHKGWQEKGIGTKLMEKLFEWAKASKAIEKIELNVRASNSRAISLYKKMGFQEEGIRKRRIKLGSGLYIDDILMALFLKNSE